MRISYFLLIVLFFTACKKEEPAIPILFTGEVVNITQDGAIFTGNFKNIDPEKVIEFGFLWGLSESLNTNSSSKHTLPIPKEKDIYTYVNDANLSSNIYYMCIYVTYQEGTYFGKTISFRSLGSKKPFLQNVSPDRAYFYDTLTITGSYFGSDKRQLSVYYNEDKARIISLVNDTIKAIIPTLSENNALYKSESSKLKVSKFNNFSNTIETFSILPPKINRLSSKNINQRETLVIHGKGFNKNILEVNFGNSGLGEITKASLNEIECTPPLSYNHIIDSVWVTSAHLKSNKTEITVNAPTVTRVDTGGRYPRGKITLLGNYLNVQKISFSVNDYHAAIKVKNDTAIKIELPTRVCSEAINITMHMGDLKQIIPINIPLKPTKAFNCVTETPFYNNEVIITGLFVPGFENNPIYYRDNVLILNGEAIERVKISHAATGITYFTFTLPNEITNPSGNIQMSLTTCRGMSYQLDTPIKVAAPLLENNTPEIYSLTGGEINGINLNTTPYLNKVFVNDTEVSSVYDITNNTFKIEGIDFDIPVGINQLYIETNGQKSNTIDINVKQRWERIALIPEDLNHSPVAFMADEKIYCGGGRKGTNNFYCFDMQNESWTKKADLPAVSGVTANTNDVGFLNDINSFYKYNFSTDTWTTETGIEEEIDYDNERYGTGFIYNNEFFCYPHTIYKKHHIYNLSTESWSVGQAFYSPVTWHDANFTSIVIDTMTYFIEHHEDFIHPYNLNTKDFGYAQRPHWFEITDAASMNGIEFKGKGYFYYYGFQAFDPETFSTYRVSMGPSSGIIAPKLFRQGDFAYVVCKSAIYRYNLNQLP